MTTLDYVTTLELISCGQCGVQFAIPESLHDKLRETHRPWWCPNGHERHYTGQTEAEREKAARIRAEARAAQAEDLADVTERKRRAAVGQLTKVKNRIRNGVCPFCRRPFANVAAHMASEHPEVEE